MTTTGKHDADRSGVTDNSQGEDTYDIVMAEDADEIKRKENGQKMMINEMEENRVGKPTEKPINNKEKEKTSNIQQPSPLQQAL